MKSFALVYAFLASSAYGHIQMSNPLPLRSPLGNGGSNQKDYSYTNPLATDGSDYPCKGYANDQFKSVATYSPGQEYNIELKGSATHGGGSCQISLSYDKGQTFRVIQSILGGCPLESNYKFAIPADAPSGDALLAWTWFNKIGNREMYMNCAQVTINGSGGHKRSFKAISRRDAWSNLPPIFEANINGPGQCKTIEGEEVNFPAPGPSVQGKLTGQGYQCAGPASFLEGGSNNGGSSGNNNNAGNDANNSGSNDNNVGSNDNNSSNAGNDDNNNQNGGGSNGSDNGNDESNHDDNNNGGTPVESSILNFPDNAPAPSAASTEGSSSPTQAASPPAASAPSDNETPGDHPKGPSEGKGCVSGTILCAADGMTWALCDQGVPVHMGRVAAGTHCAHGGMRRLPSGEPSGQLPQVENCVSGTIICSENRLTWSLCDQGVPVYMGQVAAGTQCVHGAMERLP